VDPAECDGEEEGEDCACDDEGGSVRRKDVAESPNYLEHALNIDNLFSISCDLKHPKSVFAFNCRRADSTCLFLAYIQRAVKIQ